MEFLDPKEQVIKIELTPYGKYLMSIGKFKPEMYAFFDDDILYDAEFAGLPKELQNDTEPRILEDTPRFAAQGMYRGADLSVFSAAPNLVQDLMPGVLEDKKNTITIQNTPTAVNVLQNPLGTSAFNSNKMPSWNISFLHSELDKASYTFTGSMDPDGTSEIARVAIPQLSSSITYKVNKFIHPDLDDYEGAAPDFNDEAYELEEDSEWTQDKQLVFSGDGTKLQFIEDYILMQIEEANAEFLKDNFTLEVFEEVSVTGDTIASKYTYYKPLHFQKNTDEDPNINNVEYYFDIAADREISEDLYCSLVKQQDKVENIYQDKTFSCPDLDEDGISADIYNTGDNADPGDIC